jgi:hypothetical protein
VEEYIDNVLSDTCILAEVCNVKYKTLKKGLKILGFGMLVFIIALMAGFACI